MPYAASDYQKERIASPYLRYDLTRDARIRTPERSTMHGIGQRVAQAAHPLVPVSQTIHAIQPSAPLPSPAPIEHHPGRPLLALLFSFPRHRHVPCSMIFWAPLNHLHHHHYPLVPLKLSSNPSPLVVELTLPPPSPYTHRGAHLPIPPPSRALSFPFPASPVPISRLPLPDPEWETGNTQRGARDCPKIPCVGDAPP